MRYTILALAILLVLPACGGGTSGATHPDAGVPTRDGGGSASDGGAAVLDGGGTTTTDGGASCSDPCRCAERGPPSFAAEASGRPSATSTDVQKAALVRANRWRTAAGLAAFDADARVEQAASAHARYLAQNPQSTCWPNAHEETMSASCAGFTGVRPGHRVAAAGYSYRLTTEVIAWKPTVDEAVDAWIWSVYHRRSFFLAELVHVGFGRSFGPYRNRDAQHNVMDFAEPRTATPPTGIAPVVFPVPGQTDVPGAFDGSVEEPEPTPPSHGWPSGAVVSAHFATNDWRIDEHVLYEVRGTSTARTCTPKDHVFITKDNDPGLAARESNEAFLYAHAPLASRTEYVVSLAGSNEGAPWRRAWSFTTR
jgi:uncharacterized protein YkwD